jgi:PKD repeat protein
MIFFIIVFFSCSSSANGITEIFSVGNKTIDVPGNNNNPEITDFFGSPTNGLPPLIVQFTDTSVGNLTMWTWNFGDGGTSTDANPFHAYATSGTYTVILTTRNREGNYSTETKRGYITVSSTEKVYADFTGNPTNGTAPLTVQFNDISAGHPVTWAWDFGDGGTDTIPNPSHTFSTIGSYPVTLSITSQDGSSIIETKKGYINVSSVKSIDTGFIGNPTSGFPPLTVQFNDTTSGNLVTWAWDFGDGGSATVPGPSHTYTTSGTYPVTLTVTNQAGNSSTETKRGYITVSSVPSINADFTSNPTTGTIPLTVQFKDTSIGNPVTWAWDFGDGYTDTTPAPSHTYTTSGAYPVTLSVTNQAGTPDMEVKKEYISASSIKYVDADFIGNPTNGTAPLIVRFNDTSAGNPVTWAWDFGDGGSDTISDPFHIYTANGTYPVTLTTMNQAGGFDTETKREYIIVSSQKKIKADFIGNPTNGTAPLTVQFIDRSRGDPTMWNWFFGDTSTDEVTNPFHVYQNPGTYSVQLQVSNMEYSDNLTKNDYISASPTRHGGSIWILNAPDTSQVFLNDQNLGETKHLRIFSIDNVQPGINTLRITKPGFTDYSKEILVKKGQKVKIIADMRIKPTNKGILRLDTYPSEATVYLDSVFVGNGSLWLPDIEPGLHSLRVISLNYIDWNHQVSVQGGGSVTYVNAALVPSLRTLQHGYVMVSSFPVDGETYLDGILHGKTPITLSEVPAGDHKVRIESPGYKPFEQELTVLEGKTSYVSGRMDT